MKYHEFKNSLLEGYREAQIEFDSVANPEHVQKTINDYKNLVNKNQVQGNERNIDWWRKQGWDKFSKFVQDKSTIPTTTQVKRKKIPGKSINLIDNDDWLVVIPIDKDASCFHGKNSSWCTTKINQSHFEDYFYDQEITLIYCINKKTGGMWAIAAHKKTDKFEMFDQKDRSLSSKKFQQQTGLNPIELRNMALSNDYQPQVQSSRDIYQKSLNITKQLLENLPQKTRSEEIEKQLLYNKNGNICIKYIRKVGKDVSTDVPLPIQLMSVKYSGYAIQYIENPSETVQLAAVNKDGFAIESIKNPSENVKLASVKSDGLVIDYIKNPSEEVQLAAVNYSGLFIQYIENPSETVQLAAVNKDRKAIKYIKNPSEAVKLASKRK